MKRGAELGVAACFLGTAATFIGFIAAYAVEASTQVLATLLGGAFTLLAVGLVLWAKKLLPSGEFVEKRGPMEPPKKVQDEFVEVLDRGGEKTPGFVRRSLILGTLAMGAAFIVPLRSLILPNKELPGPALSHTPWRPGGLRLMTHEGDLVKADEMKVGTVLTVFPDGHPDADDAMTIVMKVDPRYLRQPGAASRKYAVDGIVAFSKICTHAGCPVGLYEQTSQQLFCPCHQSVFDVLDAGRRVSGPAVRPLPQLPLAIDGEGYVIATGDYDGFVGPSWWTRY